MCLGGYWIIYNLSCLQFYYIFLFDASSIIKWKFYFSENLIIVDSKYLFKKWNSLTNGSSLIKDLGFLEAHSILRILFSVNHYYGWNFIDDALAIPTVLCSLNQCNVLFVGLFIYLWKIAYAFVFCLIFVSLFFTKDIFSTLHFLCSMI